MHVGSAVAFPKSIEFWKDRRISLVILLAEKHAEKPGLDIFPKGWGSKLLICPICLAGVVGGRLWLTGFPLCFCEKYGKLA
eukprot:COSAG01_NODE_41495_length_450_cov_20.797721_1_plen_80_part_10